MGTDTLLAVNLETPTDLKLLTDHEVCAEVRINYFRFHKLRKKHLIPYYKLGYRTYRYDATEVRNALLKLRVKAVS
jgi:hypothetical protein